METRTTVYTTDTAEARRVAVRAMGAASGQRPIAAWRKELSDCSVTITSLAAALDTARDELAAIRAHCYGPGNESAMDQMLARAKAAEAENAALRNELARYQGMTMHADHPAVIAAERDRLRARLDMLIAQCFDPLDDDDPDHFKVAATAIRAALATEET